MEKTTKKIKHPHVIRHEMQRDIDHILGNARGIICDNSGDCLEVDFDVDLVLSNMNSKNNSTVKIQGSVKHLRSKSEFHSQEISVYNPRISSNTKNPQWFFTKLVNAVGFLF